MLQRIIRNEHKNNNIQWHQIPYNTGMHLTKYVQDLYA